MAHALWNLRLLRTYQNLSQLDVAAGTGCLTQARVSDLELGRLPDDADVDALARALALDPGILVANAIVISRSGRVRVAR